MMKTNNLKQQVIGANNYNNQQNDFMFDEKQMKLFFDMEFDFAWNKINNREKIKKNFVKKILAMVNMFYFQEIIKRNLPIPLQDFKLLRDMIPYIAYEHYFRTSHLEDSERCFLQDNMDYQNKIVSEVTAKLLFNEHLQINPLSYTNKYSPEISSIKIFARFLKYYILEVFPNIKEPSKKLDTLLNLCVKFLGSITAIVNLLSEGYDSEAYSLWRSCHELECTIIVLHMFDERLTEAYLNNLEYLPLDYDENNDSDLAKKLKEHMDYYDIKNKKAFINLGWILGIKDYKNKNLSFKETLSKIAKKEDIYNFYKDASKVIHSSAIHVAYNRDAFHASCIYQVYQSFSSIEQIINLIFINDLLVFNKEMVDRYSNERNKYFDSTKEVLEILIKRLNIGLYG